MRTTGHTTPQVPRRSTNDAPAGISPPQLGPTAIIAFAPIVAVTPVCDLRAIVWDPYWPSQVGVVFEGFNVYSTAFAYTHRIPSIAVIDLQLIPPCQQPSQDYSKNSIPPSVLHISRFHTPDYMIDQIKCVTSPHNGVFSHQRLRSEPNPYHQYTLPAKGATCTLSTWTCTPATGPQFTVMSTFSASVCAWNVAARVCHHPAATA